MEGAFAMSQKLHGGGLTAFLVGVAEGQEGRILGEFPAHEGGRAERPLTPPPPEFVNLLAAFCAGPPSESLDQL